MNRLKLYLYIFLGILFFTKIAMAYEFPVLSDNPLLPPFHQIDKKRLCAYPQIIIYGINSYLQVKDKPCPNQVRIITGILYLSRVYHPSNIYISPLPDPKTLRAFGDRFTVIYSNHLGFYVEELKKYYDLKIVKLKSIYDLEKILPQVLKERRKIILLPDEFLLDERGLAILRYWLKKYPHATIINLLGLNFEYPKMITIPFSQRKYLEEILKFLKSEDLERGKIYYVVY
ncbi:MAG: hypothetical protein ABWJ99_06135 [Caldimicrobium sp.]